MRRVMLPVPRDTKVTLCVYCVSASTERQNQEEQTFPFPGETKSLNSK